MRKISKRIAAIGSLIILFGVAVLYYYTHPHIYRVPSDKDTTEAISFFALGDQGSGGYSQWQVARAMEQVAEKEGNLDFVALLGDNFYHDGATTLDSSQWLSKFEHVYSGTYLSATPFYVALGNHDHGHPDEGINPSPSTAKVPPDEIQIDYFRGHLGSNRWRMPDHRYSVDFGKVQDRPLLRVVVIDTDPAQRDLSKEADFIRAQFRTAKDSPIWKVVIGHHPVRTYGRHQQQIDDAMLTKILPAMQEAHVDLYLCGHDHAQQIIARNGEPFYAVSGGGGAALSSVAGPHGDLVYSRSGYGFVNAKLDKDSLSMSSYDEHGEKLAEYKIPRACSYGQASCLVPVTN